MATPRCGKLGSGRSNGKKCQRHLANSLRARRDSRYISGSKAPGRPGATASGAPISGGQQDRQPAQLEMICSTVMLVKKAPKATGLHSAK
jgi:hypothetical protein